MPRRRGLVLHALTPYKISSRTGLPLAGHLDPRCILPRRGALVTPLATLWAGSALELRSVALSQVTGGCPHAAEHAPAFDVASAPMSLARAEAVCTLLDEEKLAMRTYPTMLGMLLPGLTAATSFAQPLDTDGARRSPLPPPIMEHTDVRPPLPPVAEPGLPIATAGDWVYTAERGYVWVPERSVTYVIGNVPSAYFYTPELGWAWYASPWGAGAFRYGSWLSQPWKLGFHAWSLGAEGWTLRSVSAVHPGTGHIFGAEGHYYDADGGALSSGHAAGGSHRGAHVGDASRSRRGVEHGSAAGRSAHK